MQILIAEKSLNGRRILSRLLKLEGHEVSVAESGNQALSLLEETRPEIVLMNVFQSMYSSEVAPAGKISVSVNDADDEAMPVVLVTSNRGGNSLAEFMSHNNQYCDAAFDLLPTKVKNGIMDRIQQMCRALKQSSRFSLAGERFNWQRFSELMDWTPVTIQSLTEPAMRHAVPSHRPHSSQDGMPEGLPTVRSGSLAGMPAYGTSAPGLSMSNA